MYVCIYIRTYVYVITTKYVKTRKLDFWQEEKIKKKKIKIGEKEKLNLHRFREEEKNQNREKRKI